MARTEAGEDPRAPVPTTAELPTSLTKRTWLEVTILALLGAAAFLAALGALLPLAELPSLVAAGRVAESVAVIALLAAVMASATIETLRRYGADSSGGRSYDLLRGTRRLRVQSMLLQLLEITAAIVLAIILASKAGVVEIDIDPGVIEASLVFLGATLGLSAAAAMNQSLRTPALHGRTPLATVLAGLAVGLALALSIVAAAAALDATELLDAWVQLGKQDAATLLLAAFLALAFAVIRLRQLPTLTNILWADKGGDRGRPLGASRASAVMVPAIFAFALMIIVFLLFLLFGIGVGDVILNVGHNPLLLGVLIFLVVALLGALAVAFALARSSRGETALYKVLPDAEVRRRRIIVGGSVILAFIFFTVSALAFTDTLPKVLWLHMLCLGLLALLGPYGFYAAREHNRIRRLEERFPDFLRDIASSHKGGLTLHQAAAIAAKGEYGDLTPEVRKMADQLSWNVSFGEALRRFSDRVQTPLVQRAVSLILEADRSGGSTTDVLLAAARDAREIKNLENERRMTMSLYTIVVYITFFVFLGVAAILYGQFAPQIVASAKAVQELGAGSGGGAPVRGIGGGSLDLAQYQLFYFMAAVVQGLGDGIVAGLLGTGKATLGLRHSFLMVLISYIVFSFLL